MRPRTGKSKANSNTKRQKKITFNSGDSPVVTHLTTSPPVRCLNRAERTGSLVLNVLWSNVKEARFEKFIFAFAESTHIAIPFKDMLFPYIYLTKFSSRLRLSRKDYSHPELGD
jgi:hypothetical protein